MIKSNRKALRAHYLGVCAVLAAVLAACSDGEAPQVSSQQQRPDSGSPPTAENETVVVEPFMALENTLNDTGITYGGNYPLGIQDACQGVIDPEHIWAEGQVFPKLTFVGQDCEIGRDVQVADSSDGAAGFSYIKIDAAGRRLDASAEVWSCVFDRVSGLMWEVKGPADGETGNAGLHDADDRFSWYSNDWQNNAGHIGQWGKAQNTCAAFDVSDPKTYCNTESFIGRVREKALCGYTDWRMPDINELAGLLYLGVTEPSIDVDYFPNTVSASYWSRSPIANSNQQARDVNFRFGQVRWSLRDSHYRVRAVRVASEVRE